MWVAERFEGRGQLPNKVWLINAHGEEALFKPDTKRLESEIECHVYKIAVALGIPHAKTEFLEINSFEIQDISGNERVLTGTLSYNFKTNPNIDYVPVEELFQSSCGEITPMNYGDSQEMTTRSFSMENIQNNLQVIERETVNMLFLDCLVSNRDRHGRNWEIMVNNDNEKIIGVAPLFDNDKSMWNYLEPNNKNDLCRVPWKESERPLKHYEMFEKLSGHYIEQIGYLLEKCRNIEFHPFVQKRYEAMESIFQRVLREKGKTFEPIPLKKAERNDTTEPRKLYVMTKPFGSKQEVIDGKIVRVGGEPILIGILTELEKDKYQFEYKTGGSRKHYLVISEFYDLNKVYVGEEVDNFIYRIIPKRDDIYTRAIMAAHNITEYDVWDLLVACGTSSVHDDAYLYEELPEGAVVYDPLNLIDL